ncbi:putative ammonium transporter 3 [Convolutriloba macropyga]|uniref:putative ammonium transporter 3 n=1 Tax=Convolutriloba macropyga TaxID=536237 RepID=UPI003F523C70
MSYGGRVGVSDPSIVTDEGFNVNSTVSSAVTVSTWDDATWILTSTFIIFTMQSGFGLLESGSVSRKNEVNIMTKNGVDVLFGSLSYWMLGYAISFGHPSLFGLMGLGDFFTYTNDPDTMGDKYAHFFFEASFATTATTIVSGAIAERANFLGYVMFSFFNTFIYVFPAHWIWHEDGFILKHFEAIDYAGSGAVHLVGGVTALTAAWMLGPRKNRYKHPELFTMDSPATAIFGLFMLWFGWMGFNCGSTYGVTGGKWKLAAKSAVTTINSSVGSGIVSIILSYVLKNGKCEIPLIINGLLSGLVGVTALCPVITPGESIIIGCLSPVVMVLAQELMHWAKIDDPVEAFAVHGAVGFWSLICVGLFAHADPTQEMIVERNGLLRGGNYELLAVQIVYGLACTIWAATSTYVILKAIDLTFGARAEPIVELLGHDLAEHGLGGFLDRKTREVFDENGQMMGIASKEMTEKEQWALFRKLILCRMQNQYPHLPDKNERRRSISDMIQNMDIDKTMKEAKRRTVQEISIAMRPFKAH